MIPTQNFCAFAIRDPRRQKHGAERGLAPSDELHVHFYKVAHEVTLYYTFSQLQSVKLKIWGGRGGSQNLAKF